jgi:hypothetical protein
VVNICEDYLLPAINQQKKRMKGGQIGRLFFLFILNDAAVCDTIKRYGFNETPIGSALL